MRSVQSKCASSIENLERRLLLVNPVDHVPGPQTVVEDTVLVFPPETITASPLPMWMDRAV